MPLSEYVDSLDGVAKSRYFDKLKVLGLAATDDPYASGDFQNAMRLWPPVEFGHIFCYFIERPGVYTRQELLQSQIIQYVRTVLSMLQWKQLKACKYFKSGFVRTMLGFARPFRITHGLLFLRSHTSTVLTNPLLK